MTDQALNEAAEKSTSVEFETRAKSCGYYEASLPDKLEYLLEVKHYSLEEGADAHVELFHRVLPEVIRTLRAGAEFQKARDAGKLAEVQKALEWIKMDIAHDSREDPIVRKCDEALTLLATMEGGGNG